jgi:hypothetical protein
MLALGVSWIDMFILTVPWDLRLVWAVLSITARAYILLLLTATGFSTYSLVRLTFRLHELLKLETTDARGADLHLVAMSKGIANLRQFHALLFLLFGLCCANEVFATLRTIQYSLLSLSAAKINVFEPVTAFAFLVLLVLTFLHAFQWAVAARLQSAFAANR